MSMRSDESDSIAEKFAALCHNQKPGEDLLYGVEMAVEAAEAAEEVM